MEGMEQNQPILPAPLSPLPFPFPSQNFLDPVSSVTDHVLGNYHPLLGYSSSGVTEHTSSVSSSTFASSGGLGRVSGPSSPQPLPWLWRSPSPVDVRSECDSRGGSSSWVPKSTYAEEDSWDDAWRSTFARSSETPTSHRSSSVSHGSAQGAGQIFGDDFNQIYQAQAALQGQGVSHGEVRPPSTQQGGRVNGEASSQWSGVLVAGTFRPKQRDGQQQQQRNQDSHSSSSSQETQRIRTFCDLWVNRSKERMDLVSRYQDFYYQVISRRPLDAGYFRLSGCVTGFATQERQRIVSNTKAEADSYFFSIVRIRLDTLNIRASPSNSSTKKVPPIDYIKGLLSCEGTGSHSRITDINRYPSGEAATADLKSLLEDELGNTSRKGIRVVPGSTYYSGRKDFLDSYVRRCGDECDGGEEELSTEETVDSETA